MSDVLIDYDRLARLVAEQLAPAVAALLAPQLGGHPELADAKTNPLGSERAFLDAHRRGDFKTFKRGREIVARWVDVLAYIQRRPTRPEPVAVEVPTPAANDVEPDASILAAQLLDTMPRVRKAGGAR